MSEILRDALLDHLFSLMAWHIDHGRSYDEALRCSVQEIRQQIRETRGDLAAMLIDDAVCRVHAAHQMETRH
jgi:hypothetical protein